MWRDVSKQGWILRRSLAVFGFVVSLGVAQAADGPAGTNWHPQLPEVTLSTAHYALGGDVDADRLAAYAECLEYIHADFATGLGGVITDHDKRMQREAAPVAVEPELERRYRRVDGLLAGSVFAGDQLTEEDVPAPGLSAVADDTDGRFRVLVYSSRTKYEALVTFYSDGPREYPFCVHLPPLNAVAVFDRGEDIEYGRLFHQAFHQFLHRYVPHAPAWINEGLASYYGTAAIRNGALLFARKT